MLNPGGRKIAQMCKNASDRLRLCFNMKFLPKFFDGYDYECMQNTVRVFLLAGLWPLKKNERNLFFLASRGLPYLALFACFLHFLVECYNTNLKLGDHVLLSEDIVVIIFLIKTVLRITVAIYKNDFIVGVILKLNGFTRLYKDEKENKMFQQYKGIAQVFTILYIVVRVALNLCFTLEPLLEHERRFPAHVQFPFPNTFASPQYEFLYLCTVLMGFLIDGAIAVGDVFCVLTFIYLTANFKILQCKLEFFREFVTKTVLINQLEYVKDRPYLVRTPPLARDFASSPSSTLNTIQFKDKDSASITMEHERYQDLEESFPFNNKNSPVDRSNIISVSVTQNSKASLKTSKKTLSPVKASRKTLLKLQTAVKRRFRVNSRNKSMTRSEFNVTRDIDLKMERHLDECAQFHIDILSFCEQVIHELNLMLFFEILIDAVLICVDLFEILTLPRFSVRFFITLFYLLMNILQIFLYCWAASNLAHESELVGTAMYLSNWLETSKSFKVKMMIIMTRSMTPVVVTAASFLPFNLEVFASILNSAYSNFNVLRTIHEKPD